MVCLDHYLQEFFLKNSEENFVYDCAVVGAGIAGLATAELLTRRGKTVLLLESEHAICLKASSDHHGWFHMGSLYSIFWKTAFSKTLINGVEDLLEHYADFPNMNLDIDDSGKLIINSDNDNGWFTGDKISYYLACHNDSDFRAADTKGLFAKLKTVVVRFGWHMHIRRFIGRHNRFHNHIWRRSSKSASKNIPLAKFWDHTRRVIRPLINDRVSLDPKTHIDIEGFDVTMRSKQIVEDLLNSFISLGGVVHTNCKVIDTMEKSNFHELVTTRGVYKTSKIVLACGAGMQNINTKTLKKFSAKNLQSPLMVTYPAIIDQNFVRMSPYVEKTINHLKHNLSGLEYSVIGGGYQLPASASHEERQKIESTLKSNAANVFDIDFNEIQYAIYWGNKTEIIFSESERNYQYSVTPLAHNVWAAIPGKFSLGFSLAIKAYECLFEEEFSNKLTPKFDTDMSNLVLDQTHTRIAHKLKLKSLSKIEGI